MVGGGRPEWNAPEEGEMGQGPHINLAQRFSSAQLSRLQGNKLQFACHSRLVTLERSHACVKAVVRPCFRANPRLSRDSPLREWDITLRSASSASRSASLAPSARRSASALLSLSTAMRRQVRARTSRFAPGVRKTRSPPSHTALVALFTKRFPGEWKIPMKLRVGETTINITRHTCKVDTGILRIGSALDVDCL